MGIIKNRHGVYCVRKKVPEKLAEAVARIIASDKERVSWLQKSLDTKLLSEAKVRAKPVLMGFDRILAKAKALEVERPVTSELSDREIGQMASYHFAAILAEDEEVRTLGTGSEQVYAEVAGQLDSEGLGGRSPFANSRPVKFGLSDREVSKQRETVEALLPHMGQALARGDVSVVGEQIDELLALFGVNLDHECEAYRRLGMAVLRQEVLALKSLEGRDRGEPIETPKLAEPSLPGMVAHDGKTLQDALPGWERKMNPAPTTRKEFNYAVRRFIELHGNLEIAAINKGHVLRFREALQAVPRKRSGVLQKMPLPGLVEWSAAHQDEPRISSATVNKLLGGVQAVVVWAAGNGDFVPAESHWADPFGRARLAEDEPEREPWDVAELNALFASEVFKTGVRPIAGGGEAAFWLPLLGLFSGARLGELAALRASDIRATPETDIPCIWIEEDKLRGKRLKTPGSARIVPLHPELVRLGFLASVEAARTARGADAALFPLLKPDSRGIIGAGWSKWFGRYIRGIGIANHARVYHSFRHNFKDALRANGVGEDLNDALTGHSGGGMGRTYGKKDKARRFGMKRLADAVASADYAGLNLSHLPICRLAQ